MKKYSISFSILLFSLFVLTTAFKSSDKLAEGSDAKSLALIKSLEKTNGGWKALSKLKDVEYLYTYDDKNKKAKDISIERYIFNGEHSWADYKTDHAVNVMPGVAGNVKQCFMDGKAEITLNGNQVTDPEAIGGTAFLRSANFYWFTMMYKLNDPGTINKYVGTEKVNGIAYNKVSLTYENTGKEADDEYILYFNPKTNLVDQFYFSLPAFGVNAPVLRMELEYEKIKGVYIATTRKGYFPNEKGEYSLGGVYTSSNIKFKNGFKKTDFAL